MRLITRGAALFAIYLALSGAASRYIRSAETIPQSLSDDVFWRMIRSDSEEAGYFRFQWMSNEREFPSVIPALKKTIKPGGVYLGVGPEQNFTYIAAVQPKVAFIFDIRRENMIEHLIYKALFEMSANRAEFVSQLFSRKPSTVLPATATVRALFQAFAANRSDPQLFAKNLQAVKDRLMMVHKFPLTAKDQSDVETVYRAIFESGPGSDYQGPFGGFRGGGSYAALITATDDSGQSWSFLANEENFLEVRRLQQQNLIVPLVGNFAGTTAIRAVGTYLKEHGATVSVFYTSNVEQYLFQQNNDWMKYYSNVATLPLDSSSVFLRSSHYSFGNAAQNPRRFSGSNYVMLLCSMMDLSKAFASGKIQSYDDVIRMSHE